MTNKESMMAVYRNQPTRAIPVAIYSRYLPRGYKEREIRNMRVGIIDYYPVTTLLAPPWHFYPGFVSEVRNAEMGIKYYWENGQLFQRRTYQTPVGVIYEEIGQASGAGSEYIRKYYITKPEDYKVMQYLVENTVFARNETQIRMKMDELGEDGVVLGRIDRCPYQKLLIELAGAQQFLMDIYTDPEPVCELMDAMDKKMDQAFELMMESCVDVFWQPDNVTSDMTPPDSFKKYCLPFYQKHSKQIRQTGKPYIVHMDGRIKALNELINLAGFDGIESFSLPQIGGDMTLIEARNAFPGKVIIPNFPSNLCNCTDDEITVYIMNLLLEAGRDVPFMLQVSEDIPGDEWKRILPIVCKVIGHK